MELSAKAPQGVSCDDVKDWVPIWFKDNVGREVRQGTKLEVLERAMTEQLFADFAIAFKAAFGSTLSIQGLVIELKRQWTIENNTFRGLAENFLCTQAQHKQAQPVPA